MRTKNDGHVFPASIPDPAVYVSRNGDVYRIEYETFKKYPPHFIASFIVQMVRDIEHGMYM